MNETTTQTADTTTQAANTTAESTTPTVGIAESKTQGAPAQATTMVEQAGGDATTGDKPAETAPQVPEKYEFKAVDGAVLSEEILAAYGEVAKELKLTQGAAQTLLDKMAPAIAAQQLAHVEMARTQWIADAKADKEFGGEKLAESLTIAKRALDAFASPALRDLLNSSGLGDNPEVIRLFVKVGQAISEDKLVTGVAPSNKSLTTADKLFTNLKE